MVVLVLGMLMVGTVYAGTLQATLSWTNADTLNSIQVEKGNSATGTFSMLVQLAPNTITYVDATNVPSEVSCYRVAYFNNSGVGSYAGPVCKTFQALPSQSPGSFTVK
jgi:hypothetical protein